MWSEVISLFNGYGIIPMVILCLGIVLCIIEVFVPGFGVFGILGSVFTVGAIITRMILGASVNQFLIMVLSTISIIVLSIIVMFVSARFGLIKHSPLIENKTSVPVNYGKDDKKLLKLLGKVGFAETEFKPTGKFTLNNTTYEARTYSEFVEKGEKVQVVEIQADKIFVKKYDSLNGKTE